MWTSLELHKQLEAGRFKLYFEPHYDVDNMEIMAVETLLLYQNDDDEMEGPLIYLPVLEDMELVTILDMWALNEVCKVQEKMTENKISFFPMYVNLSARTVCNPYNIYDIALVYNGYNLAKDAVHFTLTFTTPCLNLNGFDKGIFFLQQKGMHIMLNCFGSEFISLALVSDISFDALLIEKVFFKKAAKSDRISIVLKHMINLSEDLNMPVVFAGIDCLSEYQYVKRIGGRCGRGEFFGIRLSAEDYVKRTMDYEKKNEV